MLAKLFLAAALTFASVLASPLKDHALSKRSSKSFAGSNNYFLHGLPADDQKTYIETLAGWGVKVVRLWVTDLDGGCLKGSTDVNSVNALEAIGSIGTYDTSVLAALDDTLKILSDNGIKAIISPHNANALHGSATCDAYCKKYSSSDDFYASTAAKADYDNRLSAILNYTSPKFGQKWSQLSDVILAFDIQNEPMIESVGKLEDNDPNDWLCGRAGVMANLINGSGVKVATGGIGGSDYSGHAYNLIDKALYCDAIDILSVHGYMSEASQWAYFITGDASVLDKAEGVSKHVMIEEWGVETSDEDDFNTQVDVFNDAGVAWLYWQVVPGKDESQSGYPSSCGYDGYEIGLSSSKGNVKDAVAAANDVTAAQDWTGYVY